MSGRVRADDLVVVISCKNAPENIGAIVTAVRLDPDAPFRAWDVSPLLPNGDTTICESCLQPIRGVRRSDTTETDDTAPCEVEHGIAHA